ncbi:non-ribosomal peptide synthetase [Arthrobacter mangrovi]|uniref:AMP-dependent synthetase n=1 Tax=Arthrobacter mangrovi TaxID=2966350 RepID=A0ABQ5MT96_9MICC|nr:non-ribosomal peptide synthetase [Arthrobacter mangrovi]GLB67211.1 AMP-dependent synthetase [Arthrobacter mangrovi]
MTIELDLARVRFAADLARYGDRPGVLTRDGALTYRELADRVDEVAGRLGPVRRLAVLAAANDVDSLIAYLAALSAGHPLILVPADKPAALESVLAAYDPDVVLRSGDGAPVLQERRTGTRHELHPELALLLSTSGSTGSPKLVRLSQENLQSNAESIAGYLDIRPEDRAATTLPMSYCYGLSVINSHLLRGAGLVLTGLSVVDPCFWELFRKHRATTFAGVPYTFELLERVGFADMDLPGLRYVTQAGGRLDPDTVRRYRELGERRGWDLFVMYGQTEATARMAYLPPRLAADNPGTIGVPVSGGAFRIEPVPGLPDGELVYSGPNVMLGYAERPEDLALGRMVGELRTGDLARLRPSGVYEVVGRLSRFVKIAGLRIDLGQVEKVLAELGATAAAAGSDRSLVVAVEGGHDPGILGKVLAQRLGLPRAAVEVYAVASVPRLANGKVDYPAVLALAAPVPEVSEPERHAAGPPEDVRAIFAEALDCNEVRDGDTFVSLGGDSLSYVAASVRLERALGHLPADWHVTPVGELAPKDPPAARGRQRSGRAASARSGRRRVFVRLETGIVLRALGIVAIIGTHAQLFHWPGMAHVLFAVAGFNFARFQLGGARTQRLKRHGRSVGRIIVPSVAFIAAAYLLTDRYGLENIVLLNSFMGPETWSTRWDFWFVEMLVYLLAAVAALLAIPPVARAERRFPFAFPLALTALGLLTRFGIVVLPAPNPAPVLWLFALGWAAAQARPAAARRGGPIPPPAFASRLRGLAPRLAVSALAGLTVPGFFGEPYRDSTILAGVLLLAWLPALPVPAGLHRLFGVLAAASLHAYLTHWLVYPGLVPISPALAVAASLAAGVAYWALATCVMGAASRWLAGRRRGRGRIRFGRV